MIGTQKFFDPAFGSCNFVRPMRLSHTNRCALAGGRLASVGDLGHRCLCCHYFLASIQTLAGYRTMVVERSGL